MLANPSQDDEILEAEVLDALWTEGPLVTREVFERLAEKRPLAYTTVLGVLQGLHQRGIVFRQDSAQSHRYNAALSRQEFAEFRAARLAEGLARLGDPGVAPFVRHARRKAPELVEALRRELAAD